MRLPRYSIPRILKLKKKIKDAVEFEYHGYAHIAEAYDVFVNHISSLLPKVDRDVVYESLRTYAGVPLMDPQIEELAWRLAGNIQRLQAGIPVPPWSSLIEDEWVPVQIQDIHRFRIGPRKSKEEKKDKKVKKGPTRGAATAFIKVLGGYPAGTVIEKFLTDKACFFIRVRLGFSQFPNDPTDMYREQKKAYPLAEVNELTGMRFMALLTSEAYKEGKYFSNVACTSSMVKWNREIMKRRQRDGFNCPRGLPLASLPCHKCFFGRDRCPAACHRLTYVPQHCAKCNKRSYHDPARPGQVCVQCLNNSLAKGD